MNVSIAVKLYLLFDITAPRHTAAAYSPRLLMTSAFPGITSLAEGVYLLCGETGGRPLRLPLLVGTTGALLIDTGNAPDVENLILPTMAKLGLPPERLT